MQLIGQLWPAGATAVEIQSGDGTVAEVPVDELGRFIVAEVPRGPVRLCVRHDDRVVQTTWVSYDPADAARPAAGSPSWRRS